LNLNWKFKTYKGETHILYKIMRSNLCFIILNLDYYNLDYYTGALLQLNRIVYKKTLLILEILG